MPMGIASSPVSRYPMAKKMPARTILKELTQVALGLLACATPKIAEETKRLIKIAVCGVMRLKALNPSAMFFRWKPRKKNLFINPDIDVDQQLQCNPGPEGDRQGIHLERVGDGDPSETHIQPER